MSEEQFQFFENTSRDADGIFQIAKVSPPAMVSPRPRVGDLVVVRINPCAVGIRRVTAGDDQFLHSPYDTVQEAVYRARQMAMSSSVDLWLRTSATTFDLIASYRWDG